jgi:hypothetical protein
MHQRFEACERAALRGIHDLSHWCEVSAFHALGFDRKSRKIT